jgi:hypothetical protein
MHLAAAIVVSGIVVMGGVWGMIRVHAAQPTHPEAVSQKELQLLRQVLTAEHRSLGLQIEAIGDQVKLLRQERQK